MAGIYSFYSVENRHVEYRIGHCDDGQECQGMNNQCTILITTTRKKYEKCVDNHGQHKGTDADQRRSDRSMHPAANIGEKQ